MAAHIDSHHGVRRPARRRAYTVGAVAVAFAAVFLAGCGSSGNSNSQGSGGGGGGTPLYGGTSAPTTTSSGTPTAQTLTVKQTPGGTSYLTDSTGKTLYLFQADANGKSNCNGGCAAVWPPLIGTVTPGSGVTGAMTTFTRSDGGKQAVLNGHPLYYYAADTAAGQTSGEGVNNFGGLWYVVSPSGDAITSLK